MANQLNNAQGTWQLAPDEQAPTDQAQMRRDEYVNLPSDSHSHEQPNSFVQGTGNQAKNVAQGAKNLVQGVAFGVADMASGAATGVGNVAHGAATGAGNVVHGAASGTNSIVQGAAGAIKSTFGVNTGNPAGYSLTAMDGNAPGSGTGTAAGIGGPTDSSNSNARI